MACVVYTIAAHYNKITAGLLHLKEYVSHTSDMVTGAVGYHGTSCYTCSRGSLSNINKGTQRGHLKGGFQQERILLVQLN